MLKKGIFSLFNCNPERYESDHYTTAVKMALKPLYNAIIQRETAFAKKWCQKINVPVLDNSYPQDLLDADYFCSICRMGIINLFAYTRTLPRQYYCCRCYKQSCTVSWNDIKRNTSFMYRFTSNPQ